MILVNAYMDRQRACWVATSPQYPAFLAEAKTEDELRAKIAEALIRAGLLRMTYDFVPYGANARLPNIIDVTPTPVMPPKVRVTLPTPAHAVPLSMLPGRK
jgi:hypothetical protein